MAAALSLQGATTASEATVLPSRHGQNISTSMGGSPPSEPANSSAATPNESLAAASLYLRNAKDFCQQEYERPQDESTNALVLSILLFFAGWVSVYAMNIVQMLYYTDAWFWFGSPAFRRPGALEFCQKEESILLAFPQTLSEALSSADGVTNAVVGSLLSFTALLSLASQLGNPSVFPVRKGHFGTLFQVVRMMAPVVATFFVPRIRAIGPAAVSTVGGQIINYYHCMFAGVSFSLAPLCELMSAGFDLVGFVRQTPMGNNYFPSARQSSGDAEKGEARVTLVDIVYKSVWVGATTARASLAYFLLFHLLDDFQKILVGTTDPQIDACGALRTIKCFVMEKSMIGLVAGMYVILAASQLCESSGRRISSLLYIVPLLVFGVSEIWKHVSTLQMTADMKENYLPLLNIPPSGFWPDQDPSLSHFLWRNPGHLEDVKKCTALLDLASVPDNCFELPSNPQIS